MAWFKVDDKLWGHPKWLATPVRARGLWVTAGSWSADQRQDGHVPRHVLPTLGCTARDAAALVASGLWVVTEDGWLFHGWGEFQPTKQEIEARAAEAKERMRVLRAERQAKRARSQDVRANSDERSQMFADVRSAPTRPDPTRPVVGVLRAVGDGHSIPNRHLGDGAGTATFGLEGDR